MTPPLPAPDAARPGRPIPGTTVARIVRRGVPALVDQGTFAATNFVLNVGLARFGGPRRYGAFAACFAVILLIATVHEAILSEPMLVFGAGRFSDDGAGYLAVLVRWHLVATVPLAAAGVAIASMTGHGVMAGAAMGAAAAAPFLLLVMLTNKAAYLSTQRWLPAMTSAVYLAGVGALGVVAVAAGAVTVPVAFAVMAGGAAVSSVVALKRLGVRAAAVWHDRVSGTGIAHWRYARWSLLANAARWVPTNVNLVILPIWAGLAATARFRAAANLTMPVLLVINAATTLLVPKFARAASQGRRPASRRQAFIALESACVAFWIGTVVVGRTLLVHIYGPSYAGAYRTLVLVAAVPAVTVTSALSSAVLRALEQPEKVLPPAFAAAVFSVTVGAWLVWRGGSEGAAWSLVGANALLAVGLLWQERQGR